MIPDSELLFPRPTPEQVLAELTEFFYTEELQNRANEELERRRYVIASLETKASAGSIDTQDIAEVLQSSGDAVNALISILGVSQERFMGILSLKVLPGKEAGQCLTMPAIKRRLIRDREFAVGVARLLLNGQTDAELIGRVPPFDLAKFNKDKLLLRKDALIDSLLRLGLKGRYDAKKGGILEDHIEEVLARIGVHYLRGEIHLPGVSRDVDFVVPNADDPYILIESGLFETTARELSDKARVEQLGLSEIEKLYRKARFVRVTDGIGWRRRGGQDLANLIQASHYFLVFKTLDKLENIIKHYVPNSYFDASGEI